MKKTFELEQNQLRNFLQPVQIREKNAHRSMRASSRRGVTE